MDASPDAAGRLHNLARSSDGVVTRRAAQTAGITRRRIQAEVDNGRWEVERRAITIVGAPCTARSGWLLALAGASPRAALDGVTALQCIGLTGFTEAVHLSIPKGARVQRSTDIQVHQLRSWRDTDVLEQPIRHVRPELAAVRAALWAASDRAAQTILAMTVQQGLTSADRLMAAAPRLPRSRRSKLIIAAVEEIAGGAEALGELDFVAVCRAHGVPIPARQDLLRRPSGVYYLDARFSEFAVTVEVDGLGHREVQQLRVDHRKHNELQIDGDTVLRVLSMELRTDPLPFMRQLWRALTARGWVPGSSSSP